VSIEAVLAGIIADANAAGHNSDREECAHRLALHLLTEHPGLSQGTLMVLVADALGVMLRSAGKNGVDVEKGWRALATVTLLRALALPRG
jgi:hypothetical protein